MDTNRSILVVDDDDVLRMRLEKSFSRRGLVVHIASDFDTAIAQVQLHNPDMAVLDLKMPGKSGLDLLTEIKAISPTTKIVIFDRIWQHHQCCRSCKTGRDELRHQAGRCG